jgi:cell division protein FtsZ
MIFDLSREDKSIIKVLGVGGGGSNAVQHMYAQGIVGVDFAICNTDAQALEASPVPTKLRLGPDLTEGRGAGSIPDVGRDACLESVEEVRTFLADNTKMLFITAGMGGGTGTGAAPIIAKLSKEMGILTVAIVTLPFTFEGRRRSTQGLTGLEELKANVDTLVIISNDKLRAIHGNLTLREAFGHADDILTTAAKGIAEIITVAGYVNVDFEDVNTVMKDSGVAIMGTATAKGDQRAKEAVDRALNSPLLEDNNIKGAQHILVNIASGTREVTMDEISEITEFVQEEAGQGTDLIWGNCYDEALEEEISVTVIATGFERNNVEKNFGGTTSKKVVVSLDDHPNDDIKKIATDFTEQSEKTKVVEFDDVMERMANIQDKFKKEAELATNNAPQEEVYNPDVERSRIAKMRAEQKDMSTPEHITKLEKEPAYLRRGVRLDKEKQDKKDNELSNWTVKEDTGRIELITDNSYLHDNVD